MHKTINKLSIMRRGIEHIKSKIKGLLLLSSLYVDIAHKGPQSIPNIYRIDVL